MVDDFVEEEFEEPDEEVNMIEGDTSYIHLTQDEYEKYLSFNQYFDEEDNNNQTEMPPSQYSLFTNSLQVEAPKKYDIRPRVYETKTKNQGQPDKVLNKDKGKEVSSSEKKPDHQVVKKLVVEDKEIEKINNSFNLENEPNKIKNHVPILELDKNTIYHKKMLKMMDFSNAVTQPNSLSLQDEMPTITFGPHIEERGDSYIILCLIQALLITQ